MLRLNIGKKCLDRVLSGEQKEVYQLDIPVNEESLANAWGKDQSAWKNSQSVLLVAGEGDNEKGIVALATLAKGEGWPEWGAEKGVIYFILKIQKVEASCEVVAEEEKAEDSIAEPEAVEVPVAETKAEEPETKPEPEPIAEPELKAEEEPCREDACKVEVKTEEPVKTEPEPEKTEEVKAEDKAEEKAEVKEEVKAAEKESK